MVEESLGKLVIKDDENLKMWWWKEKIKGFNGFWTKEQCGKDGKYFNFC